MSHELRTPLDGVLGLTGLLRETELSDEQDHLLGMMERSGRALVGVLESSLDFARMEEGGYLPRVEDVDLIAILDDVLELSSERARRGGLELALEYSHGIPTRVRTDGQALRQVLWNLVRNAVKFTAKGGVRVVAGVTDDKRPRLLLRVEDTGRGIEIAKQESLFSPFVQGAEEDRGVDGGAGLGLWICRTLIEALGGTVRIASEVGRGSVMQVSIPLPGRSEQHAAPLTGRRVLVLGHEADTVQAAGNLRALGAVVHRAVTPEDLLGRMAEAHEDPAHRYHGVFMSVSAGTEGLCALRGLPRDAFHAGARILADESMPACESACPTMPIEVQRLPTPLRWSEVVETLSACCDEEHAVAILKGRVLVIEDDAVSRRIMEKRLEDLGLVPDLASRASEAQEALKKGDYDLVLTDLNLPDAEGAGLVHLLRAAIEQRVQQGLGPVSHPRLVAVSGISDREVEAQCRAAGVEALVKKPVVPGQLREVLIWALAESPSLQRS